VTPGAATEGVIPLFFPEKPGDLFFLIAVTIIIAFLLLSSGVTFFYLSDLVSPLFFVNLPTKKFFLRVSPPWRVSPGAVRLPPPSDATGDSYIREEPPPTFFLNRAMLRLNPALSIQCY